MCVGHVTLRHHRLSDVQNEFNEGFPCSQYLGLTALHELVFMEYNEETVLFFIHVTHAFNRHKIAVINTWPFDQGTFLLLNQFRTEYEHHRRGLVGT